MYKKQLARILSNLFKQKTIVSTVKSNSVIKNELLLKLRLVLEILKIEKEDKQLLIR